MYLKAFIQSFGQISTVVSEKIQFEFLYVHDLWPRSRNDLDLQYSHIFIYYIPSYEIQGNINTIICIFEKVIFSLVKKAYILYFS